MNKQPTLGDLARKDIQHEHDKMEVKPDEPVEDVARRMYSIHIEIYSAYCGHDLENNFDCLPPKTRASWKSVAKGKLAIARVKERG